MRKYLLFKFLAITLLIYSNSFSQTGIWKLNEEQKEFIAAKVSKIQADMDDLKRIHKIYQQDILYNFDRRNIVQEYNGIGINCFELNPNDKNQTYDIETKKLQIEGISDSTCSIYHSFHVDNGEQYFVAVDNSGNVFLLRDFWIDEFNKYIRKKIGDINSSSKALNVAKIYIHTKLYSPFERKKVIIDQENLELYKSKYPYLKPVEINGDEKGTYNISLFTISPYSDEVIYFEFQISKTGEVKYSMAVRNESKVRE